MKTRNDTEMVNKMNNEMDKMNKEHDRMKRIEMVKNMFEKILISPDGITFMNKHDRFKKTIKQKLKEFYNEPTIQKDVVEWYMKIFKEPIQIQIQKSDALPEENEENVALPEKTGGAMCGISYYDEWVKDITSSAILTREGKKFIREVWDIWQDIDNSQTMHDANWYNGELYELLTTQYGQMMLTKFPKLTSDMKNEIYYQWGEGRIENWEEWWYDVFGTSIYEE